FTTPAHAPRVIWIATIPIAPKKEKPAACWLCLASCEADSPVCCFKASQAGLPASRTRVSPAPLEQSAAVILQWFRKLSSIALQEMFALCPLDTAFERTDAAFFCIRDEVQEFARRCAEFHRRRFSKSLRYV